MYIHVRSIIMAEMSINRLLPQTRRALSHAFACRTCRIVFHPCNIEVRVAGGSAVEQATDWDEAGKSYRLKFVEGQMPLKEAGAKFHVEELPGGRSKVTADFNFVMKYGFLGKLIEYFVLKPRIDPTLDKLFAGFAYHARTGKTVTNRDSLEALIEGSGQQF